MILVDSSIWVGHLRSADAGLVELLDGGAVLVHPIVIGELACGKVPRRAEVLRLLQRLPLAPSEHDDEVLGFIDRHRLMGRGIGYIDAHLLAATLLARETRLWTADARLAAAAAGLFIAYDPTN
ncbi:MAG TPA: type II toxin-antitoxin system VapC family toxin [Longimicrobiales bacterium]|nr:type II toxin-antitoxin system VapC family toxin [Longimicrobiales bacterium]